MTKLYSFNIEGQSAKYYECDTSEISIHTVEQYIQHHAFFQLSSIHSFESHHSFPLLNSRGFLACTENQRISLVEEAELMRGNC